MQRGKRKPPTSSRRKNANVLDASSVPEAPAALQFPAPPVPTTLPMPARKRAPSNFLQKGENDMGSASCRSASSVGATRGSRPSQGRPDAGTPGSSRRRCESSGCLQRTAKRSPKVPRGTSVTGCKSFSEFPDLSETPTLREAWVPAAAIGGNIPGCGGNPIGGAFKKSALSSDLDYRKALSYERVAHKVEKQMRGSSGKPRGRPVSAGIFKAYPEAARVLQASVV